MRPLGLGDVWGHVNVRSLGMVQGIPGALFTYSLAVLRVSTLRLQVVGFNRYS